MWRNFVSSTGRSDATHLYRYRRILQGVSSELSSHLLACLILRPRSIVVSVEHVGMSLSSVPSFASESFDAHMSGSGQSQMGSAVVAKLRPKSGTGAAETIARNAAADGGKYMYGAAWGS
jgi:hypothetical protein